MPFGRKNPEVGLVMRLRGAMPWSTQLPAHSMRPRSSAYRIGLIQRLDLLFDALDAERLGRAELKDSA